ncbi:hypothetical protein P4S91_26365, partial [Aneurinibacillus aneurinilyticus]|uniref:hypothetical protein n=1 Tax=Aneurinibacillus aneurinilyticus TaxID=1391 RepID=UPI002E1DAC5B|nr:hypothetical protein [Aneurinibacillus aneurinilyticus]
MVVIIFRFMPHSSFPKKSNYVWYAHLFMYHTEKLILIIFRIIYSRLLIIHKAEERRCTRRRVPSSFSHKEETRPLCGARAGPAKHLGLSVRETVAGRFRPWRHTLHTEKQRGRTP